MTNCSRCGAENDSAYRFCARCGKPLQAAPAAESGPAGDPMVVEAATAAPLGASSSGEAPNPLPPIVPTAVDPGMERGTRLALIAVAAGALLVVGSAVGFRMTRTRRVAARPAATRPGDTRQTAGSTLAPTPALPVAPAAGGSSPALPSAPIAPPTGSSASGTVPTATSREANRLPPLRDAEPAGLAPAIVRRVEPATSTPESPSVAAPPTTNGIPGAPPAGSPGTARAEKPRRVELRGPDDSLISIDVRDAGERGTEGAREQGREGASEGNGRVNVRIDPAPQAWSPGQEAAQQLAAAREAQREGRAGEARDAYAEAARLYRLLLNRGGSEAVSARRGLAEAERGLRGVGER